MDVLYQLKPQDVENLNSLGAYEAARLWSLFFYLWICVRETTKPQLGSDLNHDIQSNKINDK